MLRAVIASNPEAYSTSMRLRPHNQPRTLSFDKDVLQVLSGDRDEQSPRISWADVNAVVAYKRDCYTVDQIRLAFSTPNVTIEISEDMNGWQVLLDSLPSLLAGFPSWSEWWPKVAQPPFETNATRLFSR